VRGSWGCWLFFAAVPAVSVADSPSIRTAVGCVLVVAAAVTVRQNGGLLSRRLEYLGSGRAPLASYLGLLLILLYLFATVRAVRSGYFSTAEGVGLIGFLVTICVVTCAAWPTGGRSFDRWIGNVATGLSLYVVVNLLGFAIGWRPATSAGGVATLLRLAGIQAERVSFPLSSGVNYFGLVAGLLLSIGLASLVYQYTRAALCWAALGFVGVVLSDSRGAIFAVVVAIVLSSTSQIRRPQVGWLIALVPLIPLLALESLERILNRWMPSSLWRGDSALSYRDLVWSSSTRAFAGGDRLQRVLGFGHFGQIPSGASAEYGKYLSSNVSVGLVERASVHNSYLQATLDVGLFGAAILAISIVVLYRSTNARGVSSHLGAAILLYFVFVAATEVVLTPLNPALFGIYISLTLGVGFCSESQNRQQRSNYVRYANPSVVVLPVESDVLVR
jgi:hypothetical protein